MAEAPAWLDSIRRASEDLGFSRFGIAPAVDATGFTDLVRWIDRGYCAEMDYFRNRLEAYRHPDGVMPGTKSIIVLTHAYPRGQRSNVRSSCGVVARYVWPGPDYHDVIHKKLKQLGRAILEQAPDTNVRGCIDTAPLLEREIAQRAGLGWRGKNTLLLNRNLGSYFFLACLLVDVELPYDAPHATSHCGTCTACLDACPTDAFPEPGVLDANRCISYLTIEHRGVIPEPLREGIGDWLFGCDVCQEVCPWNRKPTRNADASGMSRDFETLELTQFFSMSEEEFRRRFRKTPLWRTRLAGMTRNAAIVLGNRKQRDALETLRKGLEHSDPGVVQACRWAIERIEYNTD